MTGTNSAPARDRLHFPILPQPPPPPSGRLSVEDYAAFADSMLAMLTAEQIRRQQALRRPVNKPFRLR